MKNRLKELRKEHRMTQAELAGKLGIAQNTLSYWEQGKYDIDSESLNRIAKIFGVTIDYVLGNADSILHYSTIVPLKTKKVPLLGSVACGKPIFASEEQGEFIVTPDTLDADFCLRAQGDSMIGARILDGDIVFIRQQETVENGQIAVVLIGDEATLKRVYYYPNDEKLILIPENPAYEPLVYLGEELSEVRIIGRAVAFQSAVK